MKDSEPPVINPETSEEDSILPSSAVLDSDFVEIVSASSPHDFPDSSIKDSTPDSATNVSSPPVASTKFFTAFRNFFQHCLSKQHSEISTTDSHTATNSPNHDQKRTCQEIFTMKPINFRNLRHRFITRPWLMTLENITGLVRKVSQWIRGLNWTLVVSVGILCLSVATLLFLTFGVIVPLVRPDLSRLKITECIIENSILTNPPCCKTSCRSDGCNLPLPDTFLSPPNTTDYNSTILLSKDHLASCKLIMNSIAIVSVPIKYSSAENFTVDTYFSNSTMTPTAASLTGLAIRLNSTSIAPLSGNCLGNTTTCCRWCEGSIAPNATFNFETEEMPCGSCLSPAVQQCQYSCRMCFSHAVTVLVPEVVVTPRSKAVNIWERIVIQRSYNGDSTGATSNHSRYLGLEGAKTKCYYDPEDPVGSMMFDIEYKVPISVVVIIMLLPPSAVVVVYLLYSMSAGMKYVARRLYTVQVTRREGSVGETAQVAGDGAEEASEIHEVMDIPEPVIRNHHLALGRLLQRIQWLLDDVAIAVVIGILIPFGVLDEISRYGIVSMTDVRVLEILKCVLIVVGCAPLGIFVLQAIAGLLIASVGLQSRYEMKMRAMELAASTSHTVLHSRRRTDFQATLRRIRWMRWVDSAICRPTLSAVPATMIYLMLVVCPIAEATIIGLGLSGSFGNVASFVVFHVSEPSFFLKNHSFVEDVSWKLTKTWSLAGLFAKVLFPLCAAVIYFAVIVANVMEKLKRWKSVDPNEPFDGGEAGDFDAVFRARTLSIDHREDPVVNIN